MRQGSSHENGDGEENLSASHVTIHLLSYNPQVLSGWVQEAKKWCPRLRVLKLHTSDIQVKSNNGNRSSGTEAHIVVVVEVLLVIVVVTEVLLVIAVVTAVVVDCSSPGGSWYSSLSLISPVIWCNRSVGVRPRRMSPMWISMMWQLPPTIWSKQVNHLFG